MKLNTKKIVKGFTLVELLVVIAIIAALAALATPVVLKQQKKASATEAINNAKQIYLLMFEYDQDTGAYPTGAATANQTFEAMVADGYTTSEDIFYAKTSFTTKPDGDATSGNACQAGEVGFLYVVGLSTSTASTAPIIATPQLALGAVATFDVNAFGGTAVVLRNDGGVRSFRINPTSTLITDATSGTDEDVFLAGRLTAISGTILATE